MISFLLLFKYFITIQQHDVVLSFSFPPFFSIFFLYLKKILNLFVQEWYLNEFKYVILYIIKNATHSNWRDKAKNKCNIYKKIILIRENINFIHLWLYIMFKNYWCAYSFYVCITKYSYYKNYEKMQDIWNILHINCNTIEII